jgi:hypothetical protein
MLDLETDVVAGERGQVAVKQQDVQVGGGRGARGVQRAEELQAGFPTVGTEKVYYWG